MLVDEVRREAVVARGDRRVRREDRLCATSCAQARRIGAASAPSASGSTRAWRRRCAPRSGGARPQSTPQRAQRANPADAEQQLLADADALVAAVEAGGQAAGSRRVLPSTLVSSKQQAVAPDVRPPHLREERLVRERHIARRPACRRARATGSTGRFSAGDRRYSACCQPVAIEPLPEIRLVGRRGRRRRAATPRSRRALQMVAGEHAEAAAVDRQRLVQAELGREVGDRPHAQSARRASGPTCWRATSSREARGARGRRGRARRRRPRAARSRSFESDCTSANALWFVVWKTLGSRSRNRRMTSGFHDHQRLRASSSSCSFSFCWGDMRAPI